LAIVLTDTQVQVLAAINGHLEIYEGLPLAREQPLPEPLADLGLSDDELYQAAADLHELGLIEGVTVAEINHPVLVTRVTARGRQELP
jgi:hypothetical protein